MSVTCSKCFVDKDLEDFYNDRSRLSGKDPYCKLCRKDSSRLREYNLKRKYGIDEEEYQRILKHQGGGCAICGTQDSQCKRSLHVDHDHSTGLVRGILCFNCNTAIGLMFDRVDLLNRAAEYLK